MADKNLLFFDKTGKPLNFEYVGPTGPATVDLKLVYVSAGSSSSRGQMDVSSLESSNTLVLNIQDNNGYNITDWALQIDDWLNKGSEIQINLAILPSGNMVGKVSFVTITSNDVTIVFSSVNGQNIISSFRTINLSTTYQYRPDGYYKGAMYFDQVSAGLYENEQIFVIERVRNSSNDLIYSYPYAGSTGSTGPYVWRSRWTSTNYGDVDVSEIIFTYKIQEGLGGSEGEPLIISYPNIAFPVTQGATAYYEDGYLKVPTSTISSSALTINVGLNTNDIYANVYQRTMIVEDLSSGTPSKVLEVDFYGETIGEDERFDVMLNNLGRAFYPSDSNILRNHNPVEPLPNYIEINEKRKELLLAGEEITSYIGSYKGLINALKFFGYQDLRIKEYWLNLEFQAVKDSSPLLQTTAFLNQWNNQNGGAYTQNVLIADILDNPNSGKYRLEQTYGPDADGNYVLNVQSEDTLVPSRTFKKTSLFGLYYDLNKLTSDVDQYGFPVVNDAFFFTQEEVLTKLFALKERLKKTYLPLNARIVDITGEGIYFSVYNTRSWTDTMQRPEFTSGFDLDFRANPDFGFIEDLRNFSTRNYPASIQTPHNYNDSFQVDVSVSGATGDAFYFSGLSATGPNPSFAVQKGNQYSFTLGATGYNFYLSTTPYPTQTDPLGVTYNGTTGPNTLIWNVSPDEVSTIYYYSTANPVTLSGTINVQNSNISDFGNSSDPLSFLQFRSGSQNLSMVEAIGNFYNLKQQGEIISLGDNTQDPTTYIDPTTGLPYKNPLGMPVVLEMLVDIWTWDEITVSWSSINLPAFAPGDRVYVKEYQDTAFNSGLTGGVFGEVVSVSYSTGEYDVLLDGSLTTETFGGELLFSFTQEYLLLTWQNIDFSNMMEVEWIVSKIPTRAGLPYEFEFRGNVLDYNKFALFLPYTGDYKVTCNVYDAFNAKTTVIKDRAIAVSPKTIDLDAWTRYRECEFYIWNEVYRSWDAYQSMWEYPAEGLSPQDLEKRMPAEMLNYAIYGNNAEDGQSLSVKSPIAPVGATGYFVVQQTQLDILSVESPLVTASQFGFAVVTTSTSHGLTSGDEITIQNLTSDVNGRWQITVLDSTSFTIPMILLVTMENVVYTTSPTAKNYLDPVAGGLVTGAGYLQVLIDNRIIGETEAGDSLYATTNYIVASINNTKTYPDFFASCLEPTGSSSYITIQAPNESGSYSNGSTVSIGASGFISVTSYSANLAGGTGATATYVPWNETSTDLPDESLRFWGVKQLNWNMFFNNTWSQAYAHSWLDYEYNDNWVGGFEIHSPSDGDFIKNMTGSPDYPFPVGVTFAAATGGSLTIQEAVDQLNNSSDPYITNFYYQAMPSVYGATAANLGNLVNQSISSISITPSSSPPPSSTIGGSPSLFVSFSSS